jgi:hypothetical protein
MFAAPIFICFRAIFSDSVGNWVMRLQQLYLRNMDCLHQSNTDVKTDITINRSDIFGLAKSYSFWQIWIFVIRIFSLSLWNQSFCLRYIRVRLKYSPTEIKNCSELLRFSVIHWACPFPSDSSSARR